MLDSVGKISKTPPLSSSFPSGSRHELVAHH